MIVYTLGLHELSGEGINKTTSFYTALEDVLFEIATPTVDKVDDFSTRMYWEPRSQSQGVYDWKLWMTIIDLPLPVISETISFTPYNKDIHKLVLQVPELADDTNKWIQNYFQEHGLERIKGIFPGEWHKDFNLGYNPYG